MKIFKPTTPSLRNLIQLKKTNLAKKPLIKNDIKGLKQTTGKNFTGKITISSKGGGHKKKYRKINFKRFLNETSIVSSIEYDPYRSANIASLFVPKTKQFYYIIAPKNLKIGDILKSGYKAEIKNGHCLPLYKIPIGCFINTVSMKIGDSAILSRSAGTFSQLIEKTTNFGKIKLSSGQYITISVNCFATIGIVSNDFFILTTLGKAGRSRWLNKRPKVRGVAMNPIDHPHGGGEGKTSGGRSSVTPWGKPTKGGKTVKHKKHRQI